MPFKPEGPKKVASETAAFDVHQTDPMRLKAEIRKDLGQPTWVCSGCDREYTRARPPRQCGCGGRVFKKKI